MVYGTLGFHWVMAGSVNEELNACYMPLAICILGFVEEAKQKSV